MLEHMTDSANAPYSMIGVEIPVHHALYWIGQECSHTLSKDQTQGVECSMMSGVTCTKLKLISKHYFTFDFLVFFSSSKCALKDTLVLTSECWTSFGLLAWV